MLVELLYEGDKPYKKHEGDAGFDLRVKTVVTDDETGFVTVFIGTKVAVPDGHVGLLFARSSLHKKGWMLANGVGVIDSTYRGEVIVKLAPVGRNSVKIAAGERIAQLVVVPVAVLKTRSVGVLPPSSRGDGGFGSTGGGVDDVPTMCDLDDDDDDQELLSILGQMCVADTVAKILRMSRSLLTVNQVDAFEMLLSELSGVYQHSGVK